MVLCAYTKEKTMTDDELKAWEKHMRPYLVNGFVAGMIVIGVFVVFVMLGRLG